MMLQTFVQGISHSAPHPEDIVADLPVNIVGRFLSSIIRSDTSQGPSSLLLVTPQVSVSQTLIPRYLGKRLTLHSVHYFTPKDIFQLIFTIFDHVPKSFQLLHCTPNTSKQQLELFFDRITHWKGFRYLVMGVNYLPNELQEVKLSSRKIAFLVRIEIHCYCIQITDACTEVL